MSEVSGELIVLHNTPVLGGWLPRRKNQPISWLGFWEHGLGGNIYREAFTGETFTGETFTGEMFMGYRGNLHRRNVHEETFKGETADTTVDDVMMMSSWANRVLF